jgi:hypothetical protein
MLLSPAPKRRRRKTERYVIVASSLLAATTLTFTGLSTTGTTPSAKAALPTVAARPEDSVADAFGIRVVTSRTGNNWDDHAKVLALLKQLNVRHIRTDLFHNNQTQFAYLRQLAAAHITASMIMGRPSGVDGTIPQLINDAVTQIPGSIYDFEGPNEWDRRGGANWAAEDRSYQKQLYTALKANPRTRGFPVWGPSIGGDDHLGQLGDVSAWEDYGNIHTYPGGLPPSDRLDKRLAASAPSRRGKPVVSSETGYTTALNTTAGHRPASDAVSSIYYPRLLLEGMLRNMNHTFAFQLLEPKSDPSNTDYIDHLGLVRPDFTPKPAFWAMSNLMQLVSDPGPAFTPGRLAYSVSNAPSDLRQLLFQKRDGTFTLFLWRDVSIWDPYAVKPLAVSQAKFTVNLGTSSSVSTVRPTTAASPQARMTGSTVPVSLGGEVVALQIH